MNKVLVVDDNDANLQLICFILKKYGYEAIKARNSAQGIELAIKEKPDLVLLDIQLLDISGLEVAKRLRASEVNGSLPSIALTSYAMPDEKEMILVSGFNGYIAKPFRVETFVLEIEKYL